MSTPTSIESMSARINMSPQDFQTFWIGSDGSSRSQEKHPSSNLLTFYHANLSTATAIIAAALKKTSLTLLSTSLMISFSLDPALLEFLLTWIMVSLSLFTAQESQTRPNPNPVFSSLVVQKGTLPPAALQMTEKITARPVPAIPAENWVRSCGSSGPDFFRESIVAFPCLLCTSTDRRLSQAWK